MTKPLSPAEKAARAAQTARAASKPKPAVQAPAVGGAVERKLEAAKTISVGCKIPQGLIISIHQMIERDEPVLGGGMRRVKEAMELPETRIHIRGIGQKIARDKSGLPIVTPYAITNDVDAETFRAWMEQHKDSDIVKKGLVWAMPSENDARAHARETRDLKTGFEPLNPKGKGNPLGDPRVAKPKTKHLTPASSMDDAYTDA